MSVFQIFSQTCIKVTQKCNLKCLHCQLWKPEYAGKEANRNMIESINDGSIRGMIDDRPIVNIVGGDPFCYADLAEGLRYLKSQSCETRVWTNGLFSAEQWEMVLPFVDRVYLYFPVRNRDGYRVITGTDGYHQFHEILDYLIERDVDVTLNMPVRSDTVTYLPDVYNLAHQKKVKVLISYSRLNAFDADTCHYIHRFRRVKGVDVIKGWHEPNYCAGVPFSATMTRSDWLSYGAQELINRIWNWFPIW